MLPASYYTPARHMLLERKRTELGRWLQKEFPAKLGLFLYFHRQTGNFVVAQWNGPGRFYDIMNCGPFAIYHFTGEQRTELKRRMTRPTVSRWLRNILRDNEYRRMRQTADESYEDHFRHRTRRKVQIVKPRLVTNVNRF